ncbi:MAG: histidine phosphatase family protein [bacterium]|nr:histidine phosphatase family protein [bacterium]
MKKLLILRHAKSDWSAGLADRDRPLNARGHRAAQTMGRVLARMGEAPDLVISSTAARAATTAQLAIESGQWDSAIRYTDDLYATSVRGALEVLMGADPAAASVMLVGHEPTWSSLVAQLTGGSVAIKTATVAAIELYVRDWADASDAHGELLFLLQPRTISRLIE